MSNDIEDIKRKWRNIDNLKPTAADAQGPHNATSPKKNGFQPEMPHSIKQRLIARLRRMLLLVAIGVITAPGMIHGMELPMWFGILWIVYFVFAAVFILLQTNFLKKTDFTAITTVEAIRAITTFVRRKQLIRLFMSVFAVALIALLVSFIIGENDPYIFAVIGAAAVAGLAIGLAINARMNADVRLMKKYLGEDPSEKD